MAHFALQSVREVEVVQLISFVRLRVVVAKRVAVECVGGYPAARARLKSCVENIVAF